MNVRTSNDPAKVVALPPIRKLRPGEVPEGLGIEDPVTADWLADAVIYGRGEHFIPEPVWRRALRQL